MKNVLLILHVMLTSTALSASYYWNTYYPYASAVGQSGSTAIHQSSSAFVSWADGYVNYIPGVEALSYTDPALALGPAIGTSFDVLCLGRGGEVTLTFSAGIRDGEGADFAVFENAFNDYFLELAFVEVSSDGTNFVRFPNYSLNPPDDRLLAYKIFGLAGKYKQQYGTPFDLNEIKIAYQALLDLDNDFTETYEAQLQNGYNSLDFDHITHIRLVDVIGDNASSRDSRGTTVIDPYPQTGTAGFDLDAVGVINRSAVNGDLQTIAFEPIPHQKHSFGAVALHALSDSGLPVAFSIQTDNATVTNNVLYFGGTGTVEVVASQPGDSTYAPASPVLRSFIVAEQIQHIFFEQVPNQVRGGADVQLRAYSTSGLPVEVQATDAPSGVVVSSNLVMSVGNESGGATLRALQPGNASVAPAEDVLIHFDIVESGAPNAPVSLASWMTSNPVPQPAIAGTKDAYGRSTIELEYVLDRRVAASCRVMESTDLVTWSNAVPRIVSQAVSNNQVQIKVQLVADQTNSFQRLELQDQ